MGRYFTHVRSVKKKLSLNSWMWCNRNKPCYSKTSDLTTASWSLQFNPSLIKMFNQPLDYTSTKPREAADTPTSAIPVHESNTRKHAVQWESGLVQAAFVPPPPPTHTILSSKILSVPFSRVY